MTTFVALGQCSWDYLGVADGWPPCDSKQELLSWEEQGGGPAATALVTAVRLGARGRFFGVVGGDPEGEKIAASLAAEGIEVRGLLLRPGTESQKAFIHIERRGGRRTILWRRSTAADLEPAEIPAAFLDGAAFLLLDGLMPQASLRAAQRAREAGVPSMLDAGRVRPGMRETAALCDYVVAGEQFFLDLGWDGSREDFLPLARSCTSGTAVVTLGERGSLAALGDEVLHIPAWPVEAVDTTGAGDVFHGALAFALTRGKELPTALRFASAAAALSCRRVGGRAGIPSLAEVENFVACGALAGGGPTS